MGQSVRVTLRAEAAAWVAGIVEGEGYIGLRKAKYPCVVVQMTDEDVVLRLAEETGVGRVFGPYSDKRGHRKPAWRWEVAHAEDAARLLEALIPQLGLRRTSKARSVLDAYAQAETPGRGHRAVV